MKNKYKIVLILLLFLITGCSVDYDIKINNDLSIEESFIALESKEILKNNYYNNLDEAIADVKDLTIVDVDKYFIQKDTINDMMGAKVTRKYNSIDAYIKEVNDYDLFLNKTSYTLSSDIATLKFKVNYEANEEFVNIFYKVDAKVNVYVPFEVINHNADSVDTDKHIYTWNIKNYEDNNKELYLSFNTKNKKIIIDYKRIILMLSILVIAFLGIMFFIKVKIKNNNKI